LCEENVAAPIAILLRRNKGRRRKGDFVVLGRKDVAANVAVKNLERARRFYEDVLGLKPVHEEGGELVTLKSGGSMLNVYRSDYAGTNKATALTWEVDDMDAAVDALKAKGVAFEHYDNMGMPREGDVYDGGEYRIAWFKDPEGNILNIVGAK
jgi:catechol 2,3-dioxygenase-like lactoylglutathione lyase family enzyme